VWAVWVEDETLSRSWVNLSATEADAPYDLTNLGKNRTTLPWCTERCPCCEREIPCQSGKATATPSRALESSPNPRNVLINPASIKCSCTTTTTPRWTSWSVCCVTCLTSPPSRQSRSCWACIDRVLASPASTRMKLLRTKLQKSPSSRARVSFLCCVRWKK